MTADRAERPWRGLSVAITTPFGPELEVDHEALAAHGRWLAQRGIGAVIAGGSLGEGSSLTSAERVAAVASLARALPGAVPVVAAVGALRTAEAVDLARGATASGARGLLVLPPYVYRGDSREIREHFRAVIRATDLPCMLYNNPGAYGVDVEPERILELVEEHPQLTGVKESSGDVRRVSAIRALLGERVDVAVGLDDCVLEGVASGAVGWVAGLANALPEESRALFDACTGSDRRRAHEIYRWFLPLLRLDTRPKFVQLIKAVGVELGRGNDRVRPPRLPLTEEERERVRSLVAEARRDRPPALPAARSDGAGV